MVKDLNLDPHKTYPNDAKKEEMRLKLLALDVEGNFISPLLSVIEGEKGRPDTLEEKRICLQKESAAVAQFFTHARTDTGLLAAAPELLAGILTSPEAHGQWVEARTRFLNSVFGDLLQPIKEGKRAGKQTEFFERADQCGLLRGDPVVVLSVAALHKGVAALDLLKPKVASAYNVLGDLDALCYQAYLRAMLSRQFPRSLPLPKIELVTGDGGLMSVGEQISLIAEITGSNGAVKFSVDYSPELFGELSEEEARQVARGLGK